MCEVPIERIKSVPSSFRPQTTESDFIRAVKCNDVSLVKEMALNINDKNIALHHAVLGNRMPMAKILIEAGASVDALDKDGNGALHHAVRRNNIPMAKILIEAGADVNSPNRDKQEVLFHAVIRNNIPMAEILIEAGADVDVLDKDGNGLLYHAAIGNNVPMAEMLIDAGAVDFDDVALNLAINKNSWDMARLLEENREE